MSESVAKRFYQSLLDNTSNLQAQRSIERVWQACGNVAITRAITVAAVGKECERQFGGPKTQSIRNAKETLRKLVELCRDEQTLPSRANDSALDTRIDDPSVRAYVRTLAEEVRQLRESEKRLRAAFKTIAPPVDVAAVLSGQQTTAGPESTRTTATAEEQTAIRRLLDSNHLFDYGFIEDTHGRITTESGMVFIERPVVDLLKRLEKA